MHNLLKQFLSVHSSKTVFLGDGGRESPKALVRNLLMLLFTLESSKMEVFRFCFVYVCIVIT